MQIQKCTPYNTAPKSYKSNPKFGHGPNVGVNEGISIGKRVADPEVIQLLHANISHTSSFIGTELEKVQALGEKVKTAGKPKKADLKSLAEMETIIQGQQERLQRMLGNLAEEMGFAKQ